ncbi:MAG: flavin reductase, partial [Paracoccaceae bacterium]|nr:flavin reductase [Paracoccaceae bacterium]
SAGQYFSLGLERAALENATGSAICGAIIEHSDHVLLEKTPNGFRPPQITSQDRGRLRQDLRQDLKTRGIDVDLGPAYSVFDDAQSRTHHAYFLGTGAMPTSSDIIAIPIGELATLAYTTTAIADMMTRYALEARTRSFALYLGDAQRGDVHTLSERT